MLMSCGESDQTPKAPWNPPPTCYHNTVYTLLFRQLLNAVLLIFNKQLSGIGMLNIYPFICQLMQVLSMLIV